MGDENGHRTMYSSSCSGFPEPDFHGEIIDELERLKAERHRPGDRRSGRVQGRGRARSRPMHLSNLTEDEAVELGSKVGRAHRSRHSTVRQARGGAQAGAEAAADGISGLLRRRRLGRARGHPERLRPPRCVLLEHHWAVAAPGCSVRAGGFRLSDGFISPLDLIGIGLVTAEEAADLHRGRRRPCTA